ncbi:MAG: aminotransferase class V-fold PLP-dependent enzyme [Aristaeellaceae bacterium]
MIYLDNAATSYPKPPQVIRAMAGTLEKLGANPGRGGHRLAVCAGRVVQRCREELAELAGVGQSERVIFTHSCTESLNLAISGMLHEGDEVLCSHGEHNAVMRLLDRYAAAGQITVRVLPPDDTGILQPHTLQRMISPKTALVIICHASNVTGVVQPVGRLGAVCHENGVPLLVDAAQTAGMLDVSLSALNADMVAMPGHKGLLGPHGTGVLILGEGMDPEPLMCGGTGSASESLRQPDMLPDRYESGTLNLPGIAGLLAGVKFVRAHQAEIHQYEQHLARRLRSQLEGMERLTLLGHPDAPRMGMVSFVPRGMDVSALSDDLDRSGVAVRGGLHCAPSIHTWLGTLQSGAVRASVGIYNTEQEIDDAAAIIARLLREG